MTHNIFRFILAAVCLICFTTLDASAAKKNKAKAPVIVSPASPPAALVVDMDNGKILHSMNPTASIYPASLTKVMTAYMTFEAIDAGKLSMDDYMPVSKRAEGMRPGKLWLKTGERITVRDAINAIIVKSANDAAVVLAEKIGGTEDKFAKMMTKRARSLGMSNTTFRGASGWHHPEQKTTVTDLVKLTIAIKRDFPGYYPLFSQNSFEFKGKTIRGHNPVSENYPGAQGMKTGFTIPSGWNLITTADRNGRTLVGVVTGSRSAASRNNKMVTLLDQHFGVKSPMIASKASPKKPITLASSKIKKKLKSRASKRVAA